MQPQGKQTFIRAKAAENRIDPDGARVYWSRHAIGEAVKESLSRMQVERALEPCEIIEDYQTTHRALPDCLVLAWLPGRRPIHAVIAVDLDLNRIFLVTVYRPAKEKWEDDWRTRK